MSSYSLPNLHAEVLSACAQSFKYAVAQHSQLPAMGYTSGTIFNTTW